jgi:hypothetical protein
MSSSSTSSIKHEIYNIETNYIQNNNVQFKKTEEQCIGEKEEVVLSHSLMRYIYESELHLNDLYAVNANKAFIASMKETIFSFSLLQKNKKVNYPQFVYELADICDSVNIPANEPICFLNNDVNIYPFSFLPSCLQNVKHHLFSSMTGNVEKANWCIVDLFSTLSCHNDNIQPHHYISTLRFLFQHVIFGEEGEEKNGNFILKLGNITTLNDVHLLYFLSCACKKMFVVKPCVCNTFTSECYVVCKHVVIAPFLSFFSSHSFEEGEQNERRHNMPFRLNIPIPKTFIIKLEYINAMLGRKRLNCLIDTIESVYTRPRTRIIQDATKLNIYKCTNWCQRFQIAFHV